MEVNFNIRCRGRLWLGRFTQVRLEELERLGISVSHIETPQFLAQFLPANIAENP